MMPQVVALIRVLVVVVPMNFNNIQAIEKVKKENERLKEQVESETRNRSDNSAAQSHALRLADQAEGYKHKIEIEQRRLEELDKQHKIMQVHSINTRAIDSFTDVFTDTISWHDTLLVVRAPAYINCL